MAETIIAGAALAIWVYLIAARGGFWLARERDDRAVPRAPSVWPRVVAVIPARDEAESIGETVGSLFRQGYRGALIVVLVDDNSSDGTAQVARKAATAAGASDRLIVVPGRPLLAGWTGKLWAVKQGVEFAASLPAAAKYLLLTDADIVYEPDVVSRLVARAEERNLVLTSLMVKLRCESLAERMLIPAFIFFFQMLYPFGWANRPDHPMAAAAGGSMLVRPDALRRAGGIDAIRTALIDDCALAAILKKQGPIWLALTQRVRSIRPYPEFGDVRRMVARSAYSQLRYSPLILTGTVLGMALTYLAAPYLALFGHGMAQILSLAGWALMALAFQPILRFYRLSPFWGLALPAIALVYMAFTLDSAYQHWRGRGGAWKGRMQARMSDEP